MIEIEVTWVATKQCRAEANRKLLPHEASTHLLTFDPIVRYLYPFQQCLKWLPYVAGAMVLVLLLFATYVRTVPPKAAKVQPPVDAPNTTTATPLTMDPVLQQQQQQQPQQPPSSGSDGSGGESSSSGSKEGLTESAGDTDASSTIEL